MRAPSSMLAARRLVQRTVTFQQPITSTSLAPRSSPPAGAAAGFASLAAGGGRQARPIGRQHQQFLRPTSATLTASLLPRQTPSSPCFSFSTSPGVDELDGGFPTERDFHLAADATLDEVQALVDGMEDTVDDYEANLSQGVLNILMGEHGTWVLNKQTPNRQIWWSSPLSGPLRFEYDPALQQWVTTRGRKELFTLLAEEVQKVSGIDIQARRTKH